MNYLKITRQEVSGIVEPYERYVFHLASENTINTNLITISDLYQNIYFYQDKIEGLTIFIKKGTIQYSSLALLCQKIKTNTKLGIIVISEIPKEEIPATVLSFIDLLVYDDEIQEYISLYQKQRQYYLLTEHYQEYLDLVLTFHRIFDERSKKDD